MEKREAFRINAPKRRRWWRKKKGKGGMPGGKRRRTHILYSSVHTGERKEGRGTAARKKEEKEQ